jgi:GPH family glycoside/pentoside/hexuronide:cation symporter
MTSIESSEFPIKRYPKRIIASFQLGNLIGLMFSQLYSQQMPVYYLDIIGLAPILYLIANIIFMLFNMFNDPLLGYLSDRSKRFTKRWGKRFPFILMGALPWAFMPIFLFTAPNPLIFGQLTVFLWFLIFQCLNDTVFSLYDVNRVALFPDKFRDIKDRKIGGAITTILETLGILLGLFIPILIIGEFGTSIGYALQAIVVSYVAFFFVLIMLPGVEEDSEMRERRVRLNIEIQTEPFFKGLKSTIKDKNLMGYILLYTCYTTAMGIVMASIPSFVADILRLPKIGEIILIFYIISVIIAAPFWYKLSYKIGIKKVAIIGAILLGLMGLPIIFVPLGPSGLGIMITILIIAGLVDGAIISMTMPIFSSVIDAAAVRTGRRKEGLYNGTFIFFSRIGIAINSAVLVSIRWIFGYKKGSTNFFELLGLRLQISVVPMFVILFGIIIFWKFYKISEKQIQENALKLKELQL